MVCDDDLYSICRMTVTDEDTATELAHSFQQLFTIDDCDYVDGKQSQTYCLDSKHLQSSSQAHYEHVTRNIYNRHPKPIMNM